MAAGKPFSRHSIASGTCVPRPIFRSFSFCLASTRLAALKTAETSLPSRGRSLAGDLASTFRSRWTTHRWCFASGK